MANILVLKLSLPGPAAAGTPVKTVGAAGVPGRVGDINVILYPPAARLIAMKT